MRKPLPDHFVLYNANVITMGKVDEGVTALGVEAGRIVRVRSERDLNDLIDQGWPRLDLNGKTVLPGFIDSHEHLMLTGLMATAVHLDGAERIADVLSLIRQGVAGLGRKEWVRGSYLNEQRLAEKRMPTRQEIDRVCPDHPVFLLHSTCHMCSFNSLGLELIGVPPDLDGVDRTDGEPTGVIRDPAILTFVHPAMSQNTPEAIKEQAIRAAAEMALAKGITTLHALDGGDWAPGDMKTIWGQRDNLPVRLVCYNESMDLSEVHELGLARVGGCICADGAFEAHTAALFEPYADESDNYGALTYRQEVMDDFIRKANRAGLQIAVHCESERSIEQVLWAMEKALRDCPRADHRHRIEHFELPTLRQIERLAAAGIMASMQPAFIPAFMGQENMQYYRKLLGGSRLKRVHPYRTILDHGIPVSGGSDSPVTPYDPLAGAAAAVNHPNPEERVSVGEALRMFTTAAAYSAFEENDKGSLEPGKLADLVVLDEDPFQVSPEKIATIGIAMVFVGGRRWAPGDEH